MAITLGIGTAKGGWIATSENRLDWDISDPLHKGWIVNTFVRAPDGSYLHSTGSTWYGAALHRSNDLKSWKQIVTGPSYSESSGHKLNQIWTMTAVNGDLLAGVDEAGLFRSSDGGESWDPVAGLNNHNTRKAWQPGLGGLAAHRILVDPADHNRIWCAISAVGVFRTDDGGQSWHLKNDGVTAADPDREHPDLGFCVHSLAHDPTDADTIWRQDHMGVYRTLNGGDSWERIQNGLPNEEGFGFPITRHHASDTLFIVPLESSEYRMPVNGEFGVYRSTDRGDSWHEAGTWPRTPSFTGVLRDAMDCDQLDEAGVYFGTTSGTIFYTINGGDTWDTLPLTLPRVLSVRVLDT